tara:strand:- start:197 stop:553 length:357 start_codon:yes stop_codon:yes gene_type:complete
MNSFIDDTIPPLEVDRQRLVEILDELASLWPSKIVCEDKIFGVDNYSCRSLILISRNVREKFERQDWGGDIEIAGVAMDFLGMAIKDASKYLCVVRSDDLDFDLVVSNIQSRDDIIVR